MTYIVWPMGSVISFINAIFTIPFSDVIIDPVPSNKKDNDPSLTSTTKVRDREPVIPVSCVNLSSDDRDLAQKLEAIAQVLF